MKTDHRTQPIKFCRDCETHFRARPNTHAKWYHDGDDPDYVNGNYAKSDRLEQYRVGEPLT